MNRLIAYQLSFSLLFFTFLSRSHGQIDTLYICNPGESVQLSGPVGPFTYQWSPNRTLDNPTIANPVATPIESTTYVAKVIPSEFGENLIINPNFSEGNLGFSSDYDFVERINIQGVYGINESAANLNPIFFTDCPDHTTGSGEMMVVDGSPIANENVWCQTIPVQSDRNYAFVAWLTSVNPENPPALQFSINGQPIGNIFRASTRVCEWRQFFETWKTENFTEAEICIVNQNTNPNGNDFALDDFAFYELEEVIYDTTVVIIESLEAAIQRRVYFPNVFSPNEDAINDFFGPFLGKGVSRLKTFRIFDRWGNLIFINENCAPNEANCNWDGTFDNQILNSGIYIYTAEVEFADQSIEKYQGEVRLIR